MFEKLRRFKFVAVGLTIVLLLVIGGLVGRLTAPVRIEERVQVKTVEVEKVKTEWKDVVITRTIYVKDTRKNVVKTGKEVIHPDGTIERETSEQESSQTTTEVGSDTVKEQTGNQDQIREAVQTVVTEKKVIPGPEWSLALMVGAAPRAGFMPPLGPPPLVVGVHVQKKIVGPLTGGVWVLTNPSLGVSLGLQF